MYYRKQYICIHIEYNFIYIIKVHNKSKKIYWYKNTKDSIFDDYIHERIRVQNGRILEKLYSYKYSMEKL